MKLRSTLAALTILVTAIAISSRAADDKAPDAPKEKAKMSRLTKPWSDLTSLTDDQKSQIREIHAKTIAEMQALRQKERADILALLNDDQKKELMKIEAANKGRGKPAADAPEDKKD